MPPLPDFKFFVKRARARLPKLLPAQASGRVFYDSPGMLNQSKHWAGLMVWTIAFGTTAALVWAFLGKVDQTVTATGRLEPAVGTLDVRSTTPGIVKSVWVKEGQEVRKGDRLAEIENLGLRARLENNRKQLALLNYENQLLNLLIDGSGVLPPILPSPPGSIASEDRVRSIQLTVQENAAQMRQLKARLASQQETLRLKQQLSDALLSIAKAGGMSRFDYLRSKDEVQQMRAQIIQTREQFNQLVSQAGRTSSVNDRQILNLGAEQVSLQEATRNLVLKAVGPGRVFNLNLGLGSVIGAGVPLMEIIPPGTLRARLYLANTDLGFVHEKQAAKLNVSSFPASEYGYLEGYVSRIGADALDATSATDQRRSDQFPLQVTILTSPKKARLISRLKPGMQVAALIVIRQRPVITLLTDTFTKGSESLQNSR